MKTAGRENPNHRATLPHNRAHGAVGQNRSRSIEWAVKQEKFRPLERCFFLTLPFIEPTGHERATGTLGNDGLDRSRSRAVRDYSSRTARDDRPELRCGTPGSRS